MIFSCMENVCFVCVCVFICFLLFKKNENQTKSNRSIGFTTVSWCIFDSPPYRVSWITCLPCWKMQKGRLSRRPKMSQDWTVSYKTRR